MKLKEDGKTCQSGELGNSVLNLELIIKFSSLVDDHC